MSKQIMPSVAVSSETLERISILFKGDEIDIVESVLQEECGCNLPFLERLSASELDRFRFAALKLSGGDLGRLDDAVKIAKSDWRDLLVAAGFAEDVQAHVNWLPTLT